MLKTLRRALTSTRVWYGMIGVVVYYLQSKGLIGEQEMILINGILAVLFTTRTISKLEK